MKLWLESVIQTRSNMGRIAEIDDDIDWDIITIGSEYYVKGPLICPACMSERSNKGLGSKPCRLCGHEMIRSYTPHSCMTMDINKGIGRDALRPSNQQKNPFVGVIDDER